MSTARQTLYHIYKAFEKDLYTQGITDKEFTAIWYCYGDKYLHELTQQAREETRTKGGN